MPLIFRTNLTERMRLLPNQSFLGIGTDFPLAPLHLHIEEGAAELTPLLKLTTSSFRNGFSIFSFSGTSDIHLKVIEISKVMFTIRHC